LLVSPAVARAAETCAPPCREGYRCQDGACVSACNPPCPAEYVCRDNRCVPLDVAAQAASEKADPLSGVHFFAGLAAGPGFSAFWPEHQMQMQFAASGNFALRVGALMNRLEVGLEFAPATWYPGDYQDYYVTSGTKLDLNLTVGYLAKITDRVYWPLRFGGGFMSLNTETVFGMLRFDLLGFGLWFPAGPGRVLVDLAVPSLRFFSELKHLGIWAWVFNLSAAYVL
jgi:hypothetical protein